MIPVLLNCGTIMTEKHSIGQADPAVGYFISG
jgi:hypothetical protein